MYVMRNCFLTTEVGVVGMYLLAESISHDTGTVHVDGLNALQRTGGTGGTERGCLVAGVRRH